MTNSIYSIGISGLAAAQAGLLTTSHNISNVNTPDYNRQEVLQSNRFPQFTGSGFIGQGVNVDTVRRVYSAFLAAELQQTQAGASQLATYQQQVSQLDNLFGDPTSGLTPALDDFFAAVNAVAANPADAASRQTMLSSAQSLVSRFQMQDQPLGEIRDGVNTQISGIVSTINSYATSLAQLNQRIATATLGAAGSQPPNDLLDQRDALINQLNEQIGATAVQQSDGTYNVFLANGQALVVGTQAYQLAVTRDGSDPQNLTVGLQTGGSVLLFRTADVRGGALGGVLAYRDNILNPAQNQLGRIAVVLAQTFNAQHRLGQDLNGAPGADFFDAPVPQVQNNLSNTGNAVLAVSITGAGALTASDYRLTFDGTNYSVTRLSDNTRQTFASLPQTVDGLTIAVGSGTLAAGDSFFIEPTRNAAHDLGVAIGSVAQIAAASPIRTALATTNTGSAQVSLGSIDTSYLASPLGSSIALTYDAATATFSGFPASQPISVTSGGTTTVYPAGTSVPYVSGATMMFGGISIVVTGAPADGDTFSVAPNTSGVGDSRNARLLAGLASQKLLGAGTASLAGGYGELVGFVGTAAHQAALESDARKELLAQARNAQQALSGVNLDEEAANLQRYQQAYQASGKVMAIANSLFDTILAISKD